MKTFTRWLLALLLVAAPAIAVVHTASANTELAPASRLVAPYITLETGRNTFLLLANASGLILNNKAGTIGGVHIEFYNKGCSRNDIVQQLSERDIDQINVSSLNASSIFADSSKLGYADIDVRNTTLYTGSSQVASSIRANALTGVVLVADSTDDFAFSYPMAASLGSSAGGVAGGTIVTRNPALTGAALQWTGRYEPFPSRLFVPVFYAEGADSAGATVTGFLSIVSPADGNWHGGGTGVGALAEAPGESISVAAGTNPLQLTVIMYDGCERQQSFTPGGHTIMGTLDTLFLGGAALRSNWTTANCTGGAFPGRDEQGSNEPLGWMDITNGSLQCKGGAAGCGAGGTNPLRGMVGVFFSRSVGGSPAKKMADNSRLWGDPSTRTGAPGIICAASSEAAAGGGPSAATPCVYNFNLPTAP